MSDHHDHHYVSVSDLPAGGEKLDHPVVARVKTLAMLIGLGGFALCILLMFIPATQGRMAYGYLWAFAFAFTLCLGGYFWSLLHHAINAGWGVSVRRIWVQLAWTAPYLFVLALPLVLIEGVREILWDWITEHRHAGEALAKGAVDHSGVAFTGKEGFLKENNYLLYQKFEYLNMSFWYVRFFLYFLIVTVGAWTLRHISLRQEQDGDFKHTFTARRVACGLIPLFAVTVTFWGIDFLQALDYTWFSTMWGVYIFAGCAWSSMALTVLVVTWLRSLGYLQKVVTMEHYHLMGKLLFAFTVFWAYIAFSQFFLIWYADLAEETKFYMLRNSGSWWLVSLLLVFGHFVLPFFCLLHSWVKRWPALLCGVCGWILLMHAVDLYWIVIPERGISLSAGQELSARGGLFFDIIAIITTVSCLTWVFLRNLSSHSLYPWRDPRLQESVSVTS